MPLDSVLLLTWRMKRAPLKKGRPGPVGSLEIQIRSMSEMGQKADSREMSAFGRLADEPARRTPLLRIKQHGALPFPRRWQRLEQVIKLKRVWLASGEDCLNNFWRD